MVVGITEQPNSGNVHLCRRDDISLQLISRSFDGLIAR